MVDPVVEETLSSNLESSLNDDVQALFNDINSQSGSRKGMLTWTLQKKVEADPSCSLSLIKMLLKKLENQISIAKTYMPIIPVLHTLYYAVIQPGVVIPHSLYQKVYKCLMELLILPLPYSAVALCILRSIKMEMTTPGSLYQRRVSAEQNLKSEHFAMKEKVFVLADPAVFSAPLEATLRAYLNMSRLLGNKQNVKKSVVLRVLQTGLEMTSQSSGLAQALEVLEDHTLKKYFQEVLLAVNQSLKNGAHGRPQYLKTLEQIYSGILAASEEGFSEMTDSDQSSVCSTAMPFPEISFLVWNDEELLWDLLLDFTLNSSSNSNKDGKEKGSRDSGIGKDLKGNDSDDTEHPLVRTQQQAFTRRNARKTTKPTEKLPLMKEKMERVTGNSPLFKEERSHTARVVVMGDDRALGRLTRAYYTIREKESKRNLLTKKLNLQLYYIPVTDVETKSLITICDGPSQDEGRLSLASHLERVDPWYSCNVSKLGATISMLPELPPNYTKLSELNRFVLDTLSYYLRCGTQPVNLPVYSVKMTHSTSDVTSVVEEMFVSHLEADIPEFRHLREQDLRGISVRRSKSSVTLFGAVLSVSYTKTSLSKRKADKGEATMTCRVVITSEPAASSSGENYLSVSLDSLNPGYDTKIQTQNISIRAMEQRTLCVCLDKDPCRTYTDVQRIEISPCLDPGCNILSRFSICRKGELPLDKYLDKVLSLPIQTFSGVTV